MSAVIRLGTIILAGSAFALPAAASPVSATLAATYFQVADGSDQDFPGGTPTVALGSMLGAHGLPIVSGGTAKDVNPGTSELTWWSPALNGHVSQTGTGTISLPYGSNMYAPNSTGTNDASFFETAVFTGTFSLPAVQDVQFQLGSDDDSFIYVDNTLIGSNPGIHGVTNVNFTATGLSAGAHSLTVFYDDRQNTGAYLSLNQLTSGVVITPPPTGTPEPMTLALLGVGVAALGAARRRR